MRRPTGSLRHLSALGAVGAALAMAVMSAGSVSAAPHRAPILGAPSDRLLVTYGSGADYASAASVLPDQLHPAAVPSLHMRVAAARRGHGADLAATVASEPGVVSVEYDQQTHAQLVPDDPLYGKQWAADNQVSLPSAWSMTHGSADVTIAVLDSGIDASHPEFSGRILPGYDFVHGDASPADDFGHGTMSSGVAAAAGNNGIGVAGGCWSCEILPVKVLNSSGSGYASTAIQGITWAADQGARVISMSFGGFSWSQAFQDAITYARDRGAVVVASAGNEGNTKVFYPGGFGGVISVASITTSGGFYSWSNRGSWVDVAAPGCIWTTQRGGSYGNFCGTSASTPLVAGIIGLMRSVRPTASVSQIEHALFGSAHRTGIAVRYGVVNAASAVAAIEATVPAPTSSLTYASLQTVTAACPSIRLRTSPNAIADVADTVDQGMTATVSGTVLGSAYVSTCNHTGTYLWWYRVIAVNGQPLSQPLYAATAFWNAGTSPAPARTDPTPPPATPAPYPATITSMCPDVRARTQPNLGAPIMLKIPQGSTATASAAVLGAAYSSTCYHVGNYRWWYRITAVNGQPLAAPLYVATAFWRKP